MKLMPKVLSDSQVKVVIDLQAPRWVQGDPAEKREAWLKRNADEVEMLIKRHVRPHMDCEAYIGTEVSRDFCCSHCGHAWTEESPAYNGGCCEEDEKNNPETPAISGNGHVAEPFQSILADITSAHRAHS